MPSRRIRAAHPCGSVEAGLFQGGGGCPASLHAARLFAGLEALVIEQTYVAKTFAGLLASVADGTIPQGEAACIVHTGGAPSVFEQG